MADKTREELFEEIKLLQKRIAELETLLGSERKQQQQQQQQIRRLATVVRDSNDAITIQDFEGNIISWNRGAELMYGYSEKETLGMNIERLTPPDKIAEQKEFTRRIIAGEAITSFETQRKTKDGRILDVWLTVTKVIDDTGKPIGIASTERDITERKKAGEVIKELNKTLEQRVEQRTAELEIANKELEAFSYSVSHDLRAPLRGMDGFSKALLDDYSDKLDDTGKGYLTRVRAAAKNMAELIDDILELSRISRKDMEFKTVNLNRIADEIMAGLKEQDPERQVDFSVQAGLTAWGDVHLLEIALQNLLGNAWKFTGKQRSAKIEFGRMKSEGQDAYFIRDDGVGFDTAYYDKLFNPFQRLHSEKEFSGTGIGLVTVRRVIERHAGRVWAESKAGKGATFYFTLNEKKEAL